MRILTNKQFEIFRNDFKSQIKEKAERGSYWKDNFISVFWLINTLNDLKIPFKLYSKSGIYGATDYCIKVLSKEFDLDEKESRAKLLGFLEHYEMTRMIQKSKKKKKGKKNGQRNKK